MARYQTGGGTAGNVAAATIVQMKTTVPFVDKVSNPEAAAGGVGAESTGELMVRAPRALRHGGRAVAANDYEDLARLASPEVARAKCVPLQLLQTHPLGGPATIGDISVIILPDSSDPKPQPSVELLTRVEEFLLTRQAATAEVQIVGPLYVRVDVTVEVGITSLEGATQVEQAIRAALAAFLHPLTGGRSGSGWDFGRQPHVSDLYAVVGGVPGVDHIRQLSLAQVEDVAGAKDSGRFLIFSGQHQVKLTFVGAQ
jgi:predicted phage baseplate assembly protein